MLPQDTIVFLNTELKTVLDGITVTISRFTKTVDQNPWEIDAHAHLSLELHYIFDGCGTIILGTNEFRVQKGQMYICAPFVDHTQICDRRTPMNEYCIECSLALEPQGADAKPPFWEEIAKGMANYRYEDKNGILDANFRMLETLLRKEKQPLEGGKSAVVRSLLVSTVLCMLEIPLSKRSVTQRSQNWSDVNYQRAIAIRNYIEANYKNNISVKDCACIFYMSERQIDRTLNKVFQESFHSLLMRTRVCIAMNRIQTTSDSMEKIAVESGFSGYRQMLRHLGKNGVCRPKEMRGADAEIPRPGRPFGGRG